MKAKLLSMALCVLFAMPCVLHAEEVEIQLMEVIPMGNLPGGDGTLDDSSNPPINPTRPTDFRATINGNGLSIIRQNSSIPSAQATVVNASTGSIVLNQQFTSSLSGQVTNSGVYVLHIQTAGGALVGQFVVQ